MKYNRLGKTGLMVSEVGCKACESRCPFGVEIADRMAKAAEVFGE